MKYIFLFRYKILNTIGPIFSDEAKKILEEIGDVIYITPSQEDLFKMASSYHIIVMGLGLNFNRTILQKARELQLLATATTGLDHIDVSFAKKRGIEVLSLQGETQFLDSITGTAELALGLMIDLERSISLAFESTKQYRWDREQFRGHTLYGKTLGIVGLGRLGKMMARFGHALGMKVIAFDPYQKDDIFQEQSVMNVKFNDLLKKSDMISLNIPLNKDTENMFSQKEFKKMKLSSCLINTSRGKIVNEKDLLFALQKKMIAGYAADVLSDELQFKIHFSNHPLVEYAKKHSNIILTPHIGGMTHETRAATDIFIANKVLAWIEKHPMTS